MNSKYIRETPTEIIVNSGNIKKILTKFPIKTVKLYLIREKYGKFIVNRETLSKFIVNSQKKQVDSYCDKDS